MKLHVKLSKFIEHTPNRATVQHIHSKQDITTICPKQQVGTLQTSKQHAAGIKRAHTWHELHLQITHFKYH